MTSAGRGTAPAVEALALAAAGPGHALENAPDWVRLLAGALVEGGVREGLDLYLEADLPDGAGLSSSAAASLAALAAARQALSLPVDRHELCLAAQRAENHWLGVPCGLMDQLAIVFAQEGHAVRVDSAVPGARTVAFRPEGDGFGLWRIDVGARRRLGESAYRERRSEVERAAGLLGVASLREVTPERLRGASLPLPLDRRARHVVTESARVDSVLEAAAARDWPMVGRLFGASHASLRDDYASSHPTLDAAQAALAALDPPVGARVTGGGFGGSLVALAAADQAPGMREALGTAVAGPVRLDAVRATSGLSWSTIRT